MTRHDDVRTIEEALVGDDLRDKVDMVLSMGPDGTYRAANTAGSVSFVRADAGTTQESRPSTNFQLTEVQGTNPLEDQSRDRLLSLDDERDSFRSGVAVDSYPNAFESIAQFFDSPDAPDLFVARTPAYDPTGHLGQHGSLAVLQSRALLALSGAGTRAGAESNGRERTVDIAPTIASLLGLQRKARGDFLEGQDGVEMGHLLDGRTVDHVVVLLIDGCNTNLLRSVISQGDAPCLAALVGAGTLLRTGMVASLPTATLANHTAQITGRHPGHSGILHHTWRKSRSGAVPDLLSFEEMFWSSAHLAPGVETIFEVIESQRPDAFTTATFEYCDRGASMSTFAIVRDGASASLPELAEVRHADPMGWTASAEYGFLSQVDHLGMQQTIDAWEQSEGNALPTLTWCNFSLVDGAGHTSGPHGELARMAIVDTDARIGEITAAVERSGAFDQTAFMVISDHGMQQVDRGITGDWHGQLAQTGIVYRDIGEGLIYLG